MTTPFSRSLGLAVLACTALFLAVSSLSGQTTSPTTLDGTSGSNVSNQNLVVGDSGLTINLGFFVDYLVVGGGGGGGGTGSSGVGGGGGAGSLLTDTIQLMDQSYGVTVGVGGTAGGSGAKGGNGGSSSLGAIIAEGGGGGGAAGAGPTGPLFVTGVQGGAGGGGGVDARDSSLAGNGANGLSGGNGGNGFKPNMGTLNYAGGGGGGAGGNGTNGTSGVGGAGGAGLDSDITGELKYYAGGGGGGARSGGGSSSAGGIGGGGNGGWRGGGFVGTVNTGGGGGGGGATISSDGSTSGGAGGSGIVIVRYEGPEAGTGGVVTAGTGSATDYTLHTFTAGASTFDLSGLVLSERLGLTLTEGITGDGDLTFQGPGRLTLNGDNTYTGATTVTVANPGDRATLILNGSNQTSGVTVENAGTLHIGSAGSIDVGGVTVNAGGVLSGTGIISGDSTILGSHRVGDSPGISGIGTQTFDQSLTYGTDSIVYWDLSDPTTLLGTGTRGLDYDTVDVGTLGFDSGTTFNLNFGDSVDWGAALWETNSTVWRWQLFEYGFFTGDLSNVTLTSNSENFFINFELWDDGEGGIWLQYNMVPEPSRALLLLGGLLGMVLRRRR